MCAWLKNGKCFFLILFLFGYHSLSFADNNIIVSGRAIIDKNTHYSNCKLIFTKGYIEVVRNAKLIIENCQITGEISPLNTQLFHVVSGALTLKRNKMKVTSTNIAPKNPDIPRYNVILFSQGRLTLVENRFVVDKPYTVSFLSTLHLHTTGFNIINNQFINFHNGLLLTNTTNGYVADNRFYYVSLGNIVVLDSRNIIIKNNKIFFSGNNWIGDGIDIFNSELITIEKNFINSGSCYSIAILRGEDIVLDSNRVTGGITYALIIQDPTPNYLKYFLHQKQLKNNRHIRISNNYFSQNRYGLTAINVDDLIVMNNIFIQRFANSSLRKFWTNNDILLKKTSNLTWKNNFYKEAYAQNPHEYNDNSNTLVNFPRQGGVDL